MSTEGDWGEYYGDKKATAMPDTPARVPLTDPEAALLYLEDRVNGNLAFLAPLLRDGTLVVYGPDPDHEARVLRDEYFDALQGITTSSSLAVCNLIAFRAVARRARALYVGKEETR